MHCPFHPGFTMTSMTRRAFLKQTTALGMTAGWARIVTHRLCAETPVRAKIQFGLVTYQWGRDLDLSALLKHCAEAGLLGVELRTTHAHGVEPTLTAEQRREVRRRFADSPVKLLGLGTAEEFHSPDAQILARAIETTKAFIRLAHDVGATGVKVRPNALPREVAPEKTIAQIGRALNTVAAFGAEYGQQLRLEVHGGCARLPIIRQIMAVATHPNATVCWNSNNTDQEEPGLAHNFHLVKDRLGTITHVRELDTPGYDWALLAKLFVQASYQGWWLLEAGSQPPADRVAAFIRQRRLFEELMARAQA
jgi:sugar phosphate isomerase/epimerase